MKIMYLTAEGFDTPNPVNHLAMTMIDDFLKSGIEVYIVQSHKTGTYSDIPTSLQNRNGLSYDIIQRPVINKTHFIRRYIDEIMYLLSTKNKWRKHKNDIDIVLLQSNPVSVFYIILLKYLLKKPIVYNLFDIFPGCAYAIGAIKQRWIYNIFSSLQKIAYNLSNVIVVPGEDMKDSLLKIGVPESKIRVIPNWYDDHSVFEVNSCNNRFYLENNIQKRPGEFIVQYAGTLGYVLDCECIIKVAKLLQNNHDIVFHIIGDGNRRDHFYRKIVDSGVKNIRTFPWQRLEIIKDVYSACDLCLIPLKNKVIMGGFPSKSTLLMACKRVVLVSIEKDTKYFNMVNNNDIGVAVPSGDPESLANAIIYLKDHPKRMQEIGEKAHVYSKKYFSRTVNVCKFIEIFNELYSSARCKHDL